MISLETKPVKALDVLEYSTLIALTLGNKGLMKKKLGHAWTCDFDDPIKDAFVVICKENNLTVGWAHVFPFAYLREGGWRVPRWDVHIFVHPDARRCGIGTLIMEEVTRIHPHVQGHPWGSQESQGFYRAMEDINMPVLT